MPRAYTPANTDKHLIEAALTEAGYHAHQFGTVAWIEKDGPDRPARRFVQLARRRYDISFSRQYDSPGNEWVGLALADLDAGAFGAK